MDKMSPREVGSGRKRSEMEMSITNSRPDGESYVSKKYLERTRNGLEISCLV